MGLALSTVCGEQPAGDLDPRRLGLPLTDQATRAIALDLVELIAIDGRVETLGRVLARPRGKRPQHHEEHDGRDSGKDKPNQHGGAASLRSVARRLGIGKGGRSGKVR